MTTLADTSAMSLALRRRLPEALVDSQRRIQQEVARLITSNDLVVIGAVRQELLSGIRERAQFERVRASLVAFPDEPTLREDHELAAEFYNLCRAAGVQASPTDVLICAVASRRALNILTTDNDFILYSAILPIELHPLSRT